MSVNIDYAFGVSNPTQDDFIQKPYPAITLAGTELLALTNQVVEIYGATWFTTNATWNAAIAGFQQVNPAYPSTALILKNTGGVYAASAPMNAANPIVWSTTALQSTNVFLNVLNYGATGNGSTDDTAAIQAALTAAGGYGGSHVYFPTGTYLITAPLAVSSGTTVEGAGYPQVSIKCEGTTTSQGVFLCNNGSGYRFENFGVTFPSPATAGAVFSFTGSNYNYVENVAIGNAWNDVKCSGTIGTFIDKLGVSKTYIPGVGNTCDSIYLAGNATETHITDCVLGTTAAGAAGACRGGINAEYQQGLFVTSCDILGFLYGLYVNPFAGESSYNSFIVNSAFDFSSSVGIYMASSTATSQVYMWDFTNNWTGGAQGYGFWMVNALGTGHLDSITITSHIAVNNQNHGLVISGYCNNIVVSSGVFSSNGQGVSTGFGISVTGATDVVIQNNRCGNCSYGYAASQAYGIHWDGTSTRLIVQDNDCNGNLTGPIQNGGANTTYRIRTNAGYNPVGPNTFSVPTSGVVTTNPYGFDFTLYISGGTVSAVQIGGASTGLTSGAFRIPAGQNFNINYSAAPTCAAFLD